MATLKITWKKGATGRGQNQAATLRTLGLRRLGQKVEREDTPTNRGLVHTVRHLVEVEEV